MIRATITADAKPLNRDLIAEALHLVVVELTQKGLPLDTSMELAQRIMKSLIKEGFSLTKFS